MSEFAKRGSGRKVTQDKDVEQLTNLKLQLHEKCKCIKGFPNGEFYQRRKPKGTSSYSSLDRLADDVYELMTCLDTEVITSEIKATINKNSDISAVGIDNESERVFTPNNSETHNSPVTMNRSSGWSEMKSKLASLEAGQIIFHAYTALSSKITNLMKIVEEQREEIKTVKVENELQQEEVNAIKIENKELRCLHAKIATNPPCYSGGEKQHKHSAFESRTSYCDLVNVNMQEIENSPGLTEDLSNNTVCEMTSSATVPTNDAGESNVAVVINTEEQPSCSNDMTKNEDQQTSKTPSNETRSATKSEQGNNNSKQGARQQKPTYAVMQNKIHYIYCIFMIYDKNNKYSRIFIINHN
jgi:hypothetical protein